MHGMDTIEEILAGPKARLTFLQALGRSHNYFMQCVRIVLCRNVFVSECFCVGMLLCRNGNMLGYNLLGYLIYGDEQTDNLLG